MTDEDFADPTDPGHEVEVLREHVRHLERRVRELAAKPVQEPVAWWCKHPHGGGFMTCDELAAQHYMHKFRNAGENGPTLAPLYAAPQQIGSADIETKDEHHDLHRRSVAIMAKALDYSARMTVAMERIASVATDWRGNAHGITGEPT